MTKLTYDEDMISDLHKEAYGFRPREHFWQTWNLVSPLGKQAMWNVLCEDQQRAVNEEREQEKLSIITFEKRIEDTISVGAGDRKTALRWLTEEAESEIQGVGHWMYCNDIPFHFQAEIISARG